MVDRISTIRKRLDKIRENRVSLINKRKEAGVPEVVLTGYTSVGKTTLFNRLTKENKYVDGKPFATLDTYSRRISLWGKDIVLTDTIGFIEDLPPVLIESFYSTLEEVAGADVVLLVMDASDDEQFAAELETSIKTLSDIGIYKDKIIPILNKIDKVQNYEIINKSKIIRRYFNYFLLVSARLGLGIDVLKFFLFWRTPGYAIYEVRPPIGGLVLGDKSYLPVKAERAASVEAELSDLYIDIRRVA
jgi:GTP-binding protein HflX